MKIRYEYVPAPTKLQDFADQYGLELVVRERNSSVLPRFFASFDDLDVKDGNILCSTFGNGSTPFEAIVNYAQLISNKSLCFSASSPTDRKIVYSPTLVYEEES